MMRIVLLLPLIALSLGADGQSWCPPGAQWTYGPYFHLPDDGYSLVTYEGDTIVGGRLAQRLSVTYAWYDYVSDIGNSTFSPAGELTSEEDGVVSTWNGSEWDTLYSFSANVGDRWNTPHAVNEAGWLEVLDTTTIVEDGVDLRQLSIGHICDGDVSYVSVITERLGGEFAGWLPFPCAGLWDGYWTLTCYRDDEIGPSDLDDCIPLLPLALHEPHIASTQLFPNPGTDHFTLSLPPGTHTITLFDGTGRTMWQQRTSNERLSVDASQLPTGIYLVRVDEGAQATRWVKQN